MDTSQVIGSGSACMRQLKHLLGICESIILVRSPSSCDFPNIMPIAQVLQGKIDILSTNGLDAALPPAPTTPGSIKAFSPGTDPIVQYVNQQMEQYVKQMKELAEEMQHALQHISDELATEVAREQQHLMLMQDQVQIASMHFLPCWPSIDDLHASTHTSRLAP